MTTLADSRMLTMKSRSTGNDLNVVSTRDRSAETNAGAWACALLHIL